MVLFCNKYEYISVKQKISISLITLSTMILLILAVIPHHHHEGMACVVMELCKHDNTINDEHTNHCDTSSNKHTQSCVAEAEFTPPQFYNGIKSKLSLGDNQNNDNPFLYYLPVLFLVSDLIINAEHSLSKSEYGEHLTFYKSAEVSRFHGLRAPPRMFS